MNCKKIFFLAATVFVIQSCSTRKATTATATTTPATQNNNTTPFPLVLPAEGTRAPGNEELIASQLLNKDVTLELLKEGHSIYTTGACTNCHGAANIYWYGADQWGNIIDDMAVRANLSAEQKNAVQKYVLAMKATQPK